MVSVSAISHQVVVCVQLVLWGNMSTWKFSWLFVSISGSHLQTINRWGMVYSCTLIKQRQVCSLHYMNMSAFVWTFRQNVSLIVRVIEQFLTLFFFHKLVYTLFPVECLLTELPSAGLFGQHGSNCSGCSDFLASSNEFSCSKKNSSSADCQLHTKQYTKEACQSTL